jgi:hypothetical protein
MMIAMGEYKNPPIQAPTIVGVPAIIPIIISLLNINFLLLASGATIASPSVVLCNALSLTCVLDHSNISWQMAIDSDEFLKH